MQSCETSKDIVSTFDIIKGGIDQQRIISVITGRFDVPKEQYEAVKLHAKHAYNLVDAIRIKDNM